ncbi:MAG: hypothetical protein NT081_10230 [Actinobacteria bacterium]|nr:hypothetical protein [Actinomycetota bacterium]
MSRFLVTVVIFGVIFALYNLLRDRIDPKFKGRPVLSVLTFVGFFALVGAVFSLVGLY